MGTEKEDAYRSIWVDGKLGNNNKESVSVMYSVGQSEPSVVEKPPGSGLHGAVQAGAPNGRVGVSDTHPQDVFMGALGAWFRHRRRCRVPYSRSRLRTRSSVVRPDYPKPKVG